MKLQSHWQSPNFQANQIPVEFLLLHYTGCDLKKTLEIFMDPALKVTSHFVIDTNGDCYDLGGFLTGPIRQGAHAGMSRYELDGQSFTSFNSMSIGIEIVNLNGNFFEFTDAQYEALHKLTTTLLNRFPALKNPARIIGHEHVASWRGKCDPGLKFDWKRFFQPLGMKPLPAHDFHVCDKSDVDFLKKEIDAVPEKSADFWPALSTKLEKRIAARLATKG